MTDEVSWCNICQSPHSPNFCAVAQYFSIDQHTQNEDGNEGQDHKYIGFNVVNLCDDGFKI